MILYAGGGRQGAAGQIVFGAASRAVFGAVLWMVVHTADCEGILMVARGVVQGGVVVLQSGDSLPKGQEVTVFTLPLAKSLGHSVLDIPPVSLGKVLVPLTADDDLLGETLEGRS